MRSYSNQCDLLAGLERAVCDLGKALVDPVEVSVSVRSDRGRSRRRVVDRLGEDGIAALVERYRSGATAREVSVEFGVSLSKVKMLVRERGVRRRDLAGV